MFPYGNIMEIRTPEELGHLVRRTRRAHGLDQSDLALAAGTGRRFIVDLENGKPTTQLRELLKVLDALNLVVDLHPSDERNSAWHRLS
jgi:y4mF family transcriptional regulator